MIKKLFSIGIPTILVIVGVVYWYINLEDTKTQHRTTTLEITGDECDAISEKAAMILPEALPFQKLEKAARKARVLENCMQDRAYVANPAWVEYAQPVAAQKAQALHVSFNEAYEAIRRKAMYAFSAAQGEPSYWIKAQAQ